MPPPSTNARARTSSASRGTPPAGELPAQASEILAGDDGVGGEDSAPAMADTRVGPPAPPEPPPPVEPPAEELGASFEEPEPKPEPQRHESIALPLRGATLRCEDFSEVGPGVAVKGTVEDTDDERGHVMIWIDAFNRRWPVDGRRIRGEKWTHVPDDYPAAGKNASFDARYRRRVSTVTEAPGPLHIAAPTYTPPRHARPGYLWVEFVEDGVDALGFDLEGNSKKRDWKKGNKGEIHALAVNGSPHLFKRL